MLLLLLQAPCPFRGSPSFPIPDLKKNGPISCWGIQVRQNACAVVWCGSTMNGSTAEPGAQEATTVPQGVRNGRRVEGALEVLIVLM